MNRKTITLFRLTHKLTQLELAELIGTNKSNVSSFERGHLNIPRWFKNKMERAIEDYGIDWDLEVEPDRSIRIQKGRKSQPRTIIVRTEEPAATIVQGVGKDEPIIYNEAGGGQSDTQYRLDLVDPLAILEVAKVLKEGADKYGANNWKRISLDDHLNHLLVHVYAYLAGDRSAEHLSHATCRALFALGVAQNQEVTV